MAVESMPSLLSAALRFAAAAVVLAVALRLRGGRGALRVDRRQLGSAALVGALLLAGGNGLVVLAESGPPGRALPSGVAALLVATVPLLVVLLRAVTGDPPRAWALVGVTLGFVGLVLLVLPGGSGAVPLAGALTVVAGATSWSVGSFLAGRLPMPADPFVATVYEMIAGSAVLAVLGAGRGELTGLDPAAITTRSWLALGYLTVAGSLVAFTAYVWLLQHAPISLVSTYAYVNPAVAVALGALLVAEPVTPPVLLGGAVIVAGVALVVTTERPRRPAVADEPTG
ncbi:EamA family transporter [Micromonospora mirobrigensis]|nr:EamA family transporter [Micromonospora mirobrigensis]